MSEKELKAYRRAIWLEWRKVVANRKKKLSSYEYKLIDNYFARGLPIEIVLRAIKQAVARAQARSQTVYSLGFINNDIESLQRAQARTNVGSSAAREDDGWRESASEALDEIAADSNDPEFRTMILELKEALPKLTRSQAEERYRELNARR